MSGFDEREKGQERKFAQDAELHFRARARRDKKLGLWIAESFLDLEESTAEAYAKDLLAMNLEEKDDGNLIAAVLNRVDAVGGDLSEYRLRKKMDALMAEAIRELGGDAV